MNTDIIQDLQIKRNYTCKESLEWRRKCIINNYRNIFGEQHLPAYKQYWTMPNKIYHNRGFLLKNCEIHQVVKEKLVDLYQCHCVERVKKIYNNNRKLKDIHSYHGDLGNVMYKRNRQIFNPGIIVYDATSFPDVDYIGSIIALVTRNDIHDVMVVWNFVLQNQFESMNVNDVLRDLMDNEYYKMSFKYAKDNGCQWMNKDSYCANGGCNTKMCTFVFWR